MGKRKPSPRPARSKETADQEQGQNGLVLAHYGQISLIESERGDIVRCATRRKLPRTVCGDRVIWQGSSSHDGVITRILERTTTLVRPDQNNRPRPVAANIDQIVVVTASRPSFEQGMLDRYLVAAELIGARPVIVVNKSDLLDTDSRTRLEDRLSLYQRTGYALIFTSTLNTDGLKDLHQQLRQHTSVLVGQSGVGKSSLVQSLLPDIDIRIGNLSKVTGLGRHTTTVAMLYHLPDGGDLIDSPGVRDFSLGSVAVENLASGFAEFRPYLGHCKFNNCRHLSEPGCAVQEAVRSGKIEEARLKTYRDLITKSL